MRDSLPNEAYNELADIYSARVDSKPHNAYYDKPAIQALIDGLEGKSILDAACGPGIYTEWLLENGALVTAIDANQKMINHAKSRTNNKARFFLANLEEPLTFLNDDEFDGIVSPLTITYCLDLKKLFKEFSRVLKHNAWFVFSTDHPFYTYLNNDINNYYKTQEVKNTWTGFGKPITIKSYYHSLSCITEALHSANFSIERITEPLPTLDFKAVDERNYKKLIKFPAFLFIKAIKK